MNEYVRKSQSTKVHMQHPVDKAIYTLIGQTCKRIACVNVGQQGAMPEHNVTEDWNKVTCKICLRRREAL